MTLRVFSFDGTHRRVYIQNVSVFYQQNVHMYKTCGRVAGKHGDVLTAHTGAHTHIHTQHSATHNNRLKLAELVRSPT